MYGVGGVYGDVYGVGGVYVVRCVGVYYGDSVLAMHFVDWGALWY